MPLKVWPNTAIGCNHQSNLQAPVTAFMFSCSGSDVLPWKDDGSGKPCAVDLVIFTWLYTHSRSQDALNISQRPFMIINIQLKQTMRNKMNSRCSIRYNLPQSFRLVSGYWISSRGRILEFLFHRQYEQSSSLQYFHPMDKHDCNDDLNNIAQLVARHKPMKIILS